MSGEHDVRDSHGWLVRRRVPDRSVLHTMWRYFTGQAVSDAEAQLHYERGRAAERARIRGELDEMLGDEPVESYAYVIGLRAARAVVDEDTGGER